MHFFRLPKQCCKHKQAAGQRHSPSMGCTQGGLPTRNPCHTCTAHAAVVRHLPFQRWHQARTWQPSRPTIALPVEACWLASNRVSIRTRWYGACTTFASRRLTCWALSVIPSTPSATQALQPSKNWSPFWVPQKRCGLSNGWRCLKHALIVLEWVNHTCKGAVRSAKTEAKTC